MPRVSTSAPPFLSCAIRAASRAGSTSVRTGSPTAARWAIARAASSGGQRPRATDSSNAIAMPIATASPCGRPVSASIAWPKLWPKLSRARRPFGVALVAGDERRLGAHAGLDRVQPRRLVAGEQGRAVRLAPGEEARIADQAVFDHLGIAGAQLARGQGGERIGIDQHQRRRVEGADQILALARIDRGLAADRGIGLGEQAGRHRDPVAAALEHSGGEAGDVADDAAADRDDMVGAAEPRFEHRVEQRFDRGQRLAALAGRQHEAPGEIGAEPVRPAAPPRRCRR